MEQNTAFPWFKEGLRFKCTGCGKCCTGAPGYVWLQEGEAEKIAAYLGLEKKEFMQRYTRLVHGRYSLLEDKKNYDCIFLKDKRCQIYPVRPVQCKTYPWWESNMASKKSWEEQASYCEGIDHPEAEIVSLDTILAQLELGC